MLVLALDTSTRTGGVALARDGRVVAQARGDDGRLHAERLPGWLVDLLHEAGHTLSDVDRFAVLSGPGGFTGLRVGLATVQGLAFALDRGVVVLSTLEVLAWGAHGLAPDVPWAGAWMRGMRGEVFTALYRPAPAGPASDGPSGLVPVVAPMVDRPAPAAERWREVVPRGASVVLGGDAWDSDGDALRNALEGRALHWVDVGPTAALLARLASDPAATPVGPHAVRPTYIRQPDAVVSRATSAEAVPPRG